MQRLRTVVRRNRWWLLVLSAGVVLIRWLARRDKPERLLELPCPSSSLLGVRHGRIYYYSVGNPVSFSVHSLPVTSGMEYLALIENCGWIPPVTVAGDELYYFVLRQPPQRVNSYLWTVPIILRRGPLTGGAPQDAVTIPDFVLLGDPHTQEPPEVRGPTFAVATDRIYWLRTRYHLKSQTPTKGYRQFRLTGVDADLMETVFVNGQSRKLAAGLPFDCSLAVGSRGVYVAMSEFGRIVRVSYCDRSGGQLRLLPRVDFSPVEHSGRLYGIRSLYNAGAFDRHLLMNSKLPGYTGPIPYAQALVSASLDGSNAREIGRSTSMEQYLFGSKLYIFGTQNDGRSNKLWVTVWHYMNGQRSEVQRIDLPGDWGTAGFFADGGYLYFVVEEYHAPLFGWFDNTLQGTREAVLYRIKQT